MTIQEILTRTVERLRRGRIETAQTEAEWILADMLGVSRTELFLSAKDEFPVKHLPLLDEIVFNRVDGFPLQYLLGYTEFYGRRFACDARALIPRPETEILVERALMFLDKVFPVLENRQPLIWDIGTGSGNIAITLALERPDLKIIASDLAAPALALAAENIETHEVGEQVTLIRGSLFAPVNPANQFTAIVVNPPYVAESERDNLQVEVREHEPNAALFASREGLAVIEEIIAGAGKYLQSNGLLALEIGYNQADAVRGMLKAGEAYTDVRLIPDLAGYLRVATAVRL